MISLHINVIISLHINRSLYLTYTLPNLLPYLKVVVLMQPIKYISVITKCRVFRGCTPLNWNLEIAIDHDYSPKITMLNETFFVMFGELTS